MGSFYRAPCMSSQEPPAPQGQASRKPQEHSVLGLRLGLCSGCGECAVEIASAEVHCLWIFLSLPMFFFF